jgi:hypothetical protein
MFGTCVVAALKHRQLCLLVNVLVHLDFSSCKWRTPQLLLAAQIA